MSLQKLVAQSQAFLFDLDGTLVDSNPDLAAAVRAMLAELGEPTRSDAEVGRFIGKGIGVLVERALNEGRRVHDAAECATALASFRRHYAIVNGAQTQVYPGVVEALRALRRHGLPCALVTNKATEFTQPLLKMLGLAEYFQCVVSGDTLAQSKPAPEPLWHACKQFGVAPQNALMIGDSANDSVAARRAGIPVLLLTAGYSEGVAVDTLDCDGLLSSLAVLPSLLAGHQTTQS